MSTPSMPQPVPVRRLTFAYEGDQAHLVSEQRINMILPPTQPLDRLEQQAGFTVILRNERGEPVYGRTIPNPFKFDVEVFDKDPKRSIRREANPHPKGTFVVLVPALENARRLEFFGHPLKPKAQIESPRRLSSFVLESVPPR